MTKSNKISVDKEFLDAVLKAQKVLSDKVKALEQIKSMPNLSPTTLSGLFWCSVINTNKAPADKESFEQFQKELEMLMRKYKIVSLSANIFNKL